MGDFGLAKSVAGDLTTSTFGTCSHMAPELMSDGLLTKAADVWSFGVLCWELYRCGRAGVWGSGRGGPMGEQRVGRRSEGRSGGGSGCAAAAPWVAAEHSDS